MTQGGKSNRESGSWVLCGSSPGTPFGAPIDDKSRKSRSEKHVGKHCQNKVPKKRCLWTPSNRENQGLCLDGTIIFTFPPGAPKQTKIVSNGYPSGRLGVNLDIVGEHFVGMSKS